MLNFPFYLICLLCSWRDKSSYRSNSWVRCASGNVFCVSPFFKSPTNPFCVVSKILKISFEIRVLSQLSWQGEVWHQSIPNPTPEITLSIQHCSMFKLKNLFQNAKKNCCETLKYRTFFVKHWILGTEPKKMGNLRYLFYPTLDLGEGFIHQLLSRGSGSFFQPNLTNWDIYQTF